MPSVFKQLLKNANTALNNWSQQNISSTYKHIEEYKKKEACKGSNKKSAPFAASLLDQMFNLHLEESQTTASQQEKKRKLVVLQKKISEAITDITAPFQVKTIENSFEFCLYNEPEPSLLFEEELIGMHVKNTTEEITTFITQAHQEQMIDFISQDIAFTIFFNKISALTLLVDKCEPRETKEKIDWQIMLGYANIVLTLQHKIGVLGNPEDYNHMIFGITRFLTDIAYFLAFRDPHKEIEQYQSFASDCLDKVNDLIKYQSKQPHWCTNILYAIGYYTKAKLSYDKGDFYFFLEHCKNGEKYFKKLSGEICIFGKTYSFTMHCLMAKYHQEKKDFYESMRFYEHALNCLKEDEAIRNAVSETTIKEVTASFCRMRLETVLNFRAAFEKIYPNLKPIRQNTFHIFIPLERPCKNIPGKKEFKTIKYEWGVNDKNEKGINIETLELNIATVKSEIECLIKQITKCLTQEERNEKKHKSLPSLATQPSQPIFLLSSYVSENPSLQKSSPVAGATPKIKSHKWYSCTKPAPRSEPVELAPRSEPAELAPRPRSEPAERSVVPGTRSRKNLT